MLASIAHRFSTSEIQELYRQHPRRESRILARILTRRGTLEGITEQDLAEDPLTEVTDQNHVGGTRFVEELARKSGIGPATRVLDLGSGLGGSARYLAHTYGCRVHGVDLSPERCSEAESLTQLVGLQHLVTFEFGDMTELALPPTQFDVLWDQGSWVHLADKQGFIRKWAPCLRSRGRIAAEDAYLKRVPSSSAETELLEILEQSWMSRLVDQRAWIDALTDEHFAIETVDDLSCALRDECLKLIDVDSTANATEESGRRTAVQLTESGLLGYSELWRVELKTAASAQIGSASLGM